MNLSANTQPFIALLILLALSATSCTTTKNEGRPSPYATDYAVIDSVEVSISYSSPGVKDRVIWGELVPYGNIWRTGANEATTLSVNDTLTINGKMLPKGKYAIFTIPDNNEWEIIFNKDSDQWGAYNYDVSKDALRLKVLPQTTKHFQERMSFTFSENELQFHWEYLTFSLNLATP